MAEAPAALHLIAILLPRHSDQLSACTRARLVG